MRKIPEFCNALNSYNNAGAGQTNASPRTFIITQSDESVIKLQLPQGEAFSILLNAGEFRDEFNDFSVGWPSGVATGTHGFLFKNGPAVHRFIIGEALL